MTNGRKVIRQPLREKSAGEELFDTPFLIETQAYNTIDENFTRIQGEFTTGDPKVDRQMAKRPARVWKSIDGLLEFWHSGVEFTLVNGMGDIERINKIIQQHLQDCEDYYRESKRSLQVEPEADVRERFEDLKALDDFGRFIYNRVRNFGRGRKLNAVEELFNTGRSIFDRFKDQEEPGALRDAPDYRRIEERIIYSGLSHRKRG